LNAVATTTLEEAKKATKPPPAKRRKTTTTKKVKAQPSGTDAEESYHFIGYVPYAGKVWELDGLKSGPLEVGEIPAESSRGWMDVARPALRRKMQKYGDVRVNLLAIVQDQYEKLSDELEMLKREKTVFERRLNEEYPNGWRDKVIKSSNVIFKDYCLI
jgi:ubiquitin carboxyl-terminal hydrolase L5